LQELFEPDGFVMDVKRVAGGGTGKAPRCALVRMATYEAAGAALKGLNGTDLHGVAMRVEAALQGNTWSGGET
jgi:hypothetical protein